MTSRDGHACKRRLRRDLHRVSPALAAAFMIQSTCTCRLQAPKLQVIPTHPFLPVFSRAEPFTPAEGQEKAVYRSTLSFLRRGQDGQATKMLAEPLHPRWRPRLQNRAGSRCAIGNYLQIGNSTDGSHSVRSKVTVIEGDCRIAHHVFNFPCGISHFFGFLRSWPGAFTHC